MDVLAQGWSSNYVSTLDPLLEKFAISKEIYKRFGDQKYTAYLAIKDLGLMAPVEQDEFYHFEEDRRQETLLVASNATASGPGQDLTITLSPSAFVNGVTYAREFFNIIFPDYNEATIININAVANTITVRPKKTNVTLSVTAGTELVVGDSNFGEGTKQPVGTVRKYTKRSFTTQIMKDNITASGSAITNEASVSLASVIQGGLPDGLGNTLVATCQDDLDFKLVLQKAYAFYWGQQNNNSNLTDTDPNALEGNILASQGLNDVVDTLGQTHAYIVGTMSMNDFDTIGDLLDREMVSPLQPILWMGGRSQYVEFENMLAANNAIQFQTSYTRDEVRADLAGISGKDINLTFSGIRKGTYRFVHMIEQQFTDPKGMGANGYNTKDLGFMIPLAKGKDPKSGKMMDAMSFRYKKLGAYNRAYLVWSRDHQQTNYDQKEWNILCHAAFQWFGANRFIKFEGQ